MARPRKLSTEEMIRIVDIYYESNGDPSQLKFSLIEEYALSLGLDVAVKAYDFRRDSFVRKRIDELKTGVKQGAISAIAYKTMDVDALLNRNHTREALKNSLLEIDASWRLLYETAVVLSEKNKKLTIETLSSNKTLKILTLEKEVLETSVKSIERGSNALTLENRFLKKMLKKYLYPAIANEILKKEGSLKSVDTEVTQKAMDELTETDVPAALSMSVSNDRQILSREELLMERMGRKIHDHE